MNKHFVCVCVCVCVCDYSQFLVFVVYLVVSFDLLEPLSVDHCSHPVLQLSQFLPPRSGFLLKALIRVL